jgi:hypothetical protein
MSSAICISKRARAQKSVDAFIAAMWLLYCRAPGRATAPGEPVDLGEIGSSPEKSWERLTPYSLAQRDSNRKAK